MVSKQTLQDYLTLCKPKVVALILITAWIGMFLSSTELPQMSQLFGATFGIGFIASSAATLNHFLERKGDRNMQRTLNRPLAQSRLNPVCAVLFGITLQCFGLLLLYFFCNLLTTVLAFSTFLFYAFFYTAFLKQATSQNIVIGGLAGAMPPLLGWTAITNQISAFALILVLIIYVWTPPHFWALAIYRFKDYEQAKLPMLTNTHGIAFTQFYIVLYSILLALVSLLPYLTRMSGGIYLIAALCLNGFFLHSVYKLYISYDHKQGLRTFRDSIVYLLFLFLALLLDKITLFFN